MKKLIAALICLVILFAAGSCAFLEGGKPENSSGTGEASSEIGSSEVTSSEATSSEATSSEANSSETSSEEASSEITSSETSSETGSSDAVLEVKSYFSTPDEIGAYIVRCFDEKRFDILAKAFSPSYDIYDYSALSALDGIEISYDVADADDSFATVRLMLNVPNPNGTAMIAGMNKITLSLHNYGDGFYLYAATREPDEAVDLTAVLGVSHMWDTITFTEFLNHTKLKTFDSTAELTTNDIDSTITYLIDNPDNLDKVNNAIYEYFGIENYCSMENGLIVDKNGMEFPGVGLTVAGINASRGASYYSYTTSGKVVTIRILATLDPLGLFLDEFVDYTVELSENSYRIISAESVPVTELLN